MLQSTLAALPVLRTQLAQQRNLLATYAGSLPADYAGPEFTLDSMTLPVELPLSVPSKLLSSRAITVNNCRPMVCCGAAGANVDHRAEVPTAATPAAVFFRKSRLLVIADSSI